MDLRPTCVLSAVAAALLLVPQLAAAQATGGGDQREARLHFELGQEHYEQGRFSEAAAEFEVAYERSGRAALLYNMYIAHRDAGDYGAARSSLQRYLATDHPSAEQRVNLESRLANMQGGGGSSLTLVGAIVAGVGAAALLGSIGTGVAALEGASTLETACPDGGCPPEQAGRIDETRTLSLATDGLWIAGASLAAAGAALLVVGLLEGSGGSGETAALTPTLSCGLEACVAGVRGEF